MNDNEKWAKIREDQESIKKNFKHVIEAQAQIAHVNRAYYESLIFQGFTEEQAIRLVEAQVAAMHARDGGE